MRDMMRPDEGSPLPGADQDHRAAPRFTLLLRMAKLVCGPAEFLCIVRDVSETGASVKLFHPLPAGAPLLDRKSVV